MMPLTPALRGLLLRCLCEIDDRRAGAHQIAVARRSPCVPPAANIIHARDTRWETPIGPAVAALPVVVRDVIHGVRRVTQRRGLDLEASAFNLRDLLPDRDHGIAEPVEFGPSTRTRSARSSACPGPGSSWSARGSHNRINRLATSSTVRPQAAFSGRRSGDGQDRRRAGRRAADTGRTRPGVARSVAG